MIDPDPPTASPPQPLAALDQATRFASEGLARHLDRRSFLKRAGSSAFLLLAGIASGQLLTSRTARAQATRPLDPPRPAAIQPPAGSPLVPSCAPPGPYCNLDGVSAPTGCQGGNCYQHLDNGTLVACTLYYDYYAAGCWTASVTDGYWTCCDCQCVDRSGTPITTCGCAQFSAAPWRGTD
ncbi:MAG: hypothetical protein M3Z04_00235 [Chloroflexota bacterium]|nr:hypothetical protein [Chloroflexota bacterium]